MKNNNISCEFCGSLEEIKETKNSMSDELLYLCNKCLKRREKTGRLDFVV